MKSATTKITLGIVALLLVTGLAGCGWSTRHKSKSSLGKGEFRVEEKDCFTDSQIRVIYAKASKQLVVYESRCNWLPGLVEFYWPKDSDIAGLLLCNVASKLEVAVDTATMTTVDADAVKDKIAEQLREQYRIPKDRDPISWACSHEGRREFYRRIEEK